MFVATAPNPNGPWTRAFKNKPVDIKFNPAENAWPKSATNPSPIELPNGSVALYFTAPRGGRSNPELWCGLENNCIGMAISKHGWQGPFEPVDSPLVYPESEDAHVFRDPRGK